MSRHLRTAANTSWDRSDIGAVVAVIVGPDGLPVQRLVSEKEGVLLTLALCDLHNGAASAVLSKNVKRQELGPGFGWCRTTGTTVITGSWPHCGDSYKLPVRNFLY